MRFISFLLILLITTNCKDNLKEKAQADLSKNTLSNANSPYLKQHAGNPVNWQMWNDEVLELAIDLKRPLLISVGYASCHWCHVMEEESFENDSIAQYMNSNFINIKVDREERPDVDKVYMNALELMTGNGGWPMNIIALPDGRPIWTGTYQTPKDWIAILKQTTELIKNNPEKAKEIAANTANGIKTTALSISNIDQTKFKKDELESAVNRWREYFDYQNGGMQQQEKFMLPVQYDFLMRYGYQTKDTDILNYVDTTMHKMMYGGIYDPIDGGFSRYSTDSLWKVPHFEKMLYDNAQLVSLYAKGYSRTNNPEYLATMEQTINFMDEQLSNGKGAYYSSLDADSKNSLGKVEEGAYYTWSQKELKNLLKDEFDFFKFVYNIDTNKNTINESQVLYRTQNLSSIRSKFKLNDVELKSKLSKILSKLKYARSKRSEPRKDKKIITSWNALAITSLVDAYNATNNKNYLLKAKLCAEAILLKSNHDNDKLYHTFPSNNLKINGYLEDYVITSQAFLKLYRTTGDKKWLQNAKIFTDRSLLDFKIANNALYAYTNNSDAKLIATSIETVDNVIPSSNAILAENLLELSHHYGDKTYQRIAENMLKTIKETAIESGIGHAKWLSLMLNITEPYYEVVIVGKDAQAKSKALQSKYVPNVLFAITAKESNDHLFKNRFRSGETLIYVCKNNTCKLPVTDHLQALKLIQ